MKKFIILTVLFISIYFIPQVSNANPIEQIVKVIERAAMHIKLPKPAKIIKISEEFLANGNKLIKYSDGTEEVLTIIDKKILKDGRWSVKYSNGAKEIVRSPKNKEIFPLFKDDYYDAISYRDSRKIGLININSSKELSSAINNKNIPTILVINNNRILSKDLIQKVESNNKKLILFSPDTEEIHSIKNNFGLIHFNKDDASNLAEDIRYYLSRDGSYLRTDMEKEIKSILGKEQEYILEVKKIHNNIYEIKSQKININLLTRLKIMLEKLSLEYKSVYILNA